MGTSLSSQRDAIPKALSGTSILSGGLLVDFVTRIMLFETSGQSIEHVGSNNAG